MGIRRLLSRELSSKAAAVWPVETQESSSGSVKASAWDADTQSRRHMERPMTALLACLKCHSNIRTAGDGVCPDCRGQLEEGSAPHEHCVSCGLGWRPVDEHGQCHTCTQTA